MAHNSKRNKRHITAQDGDDYIYPTKKVRETKTRDRRSSKNLIKKGLIEYENHDPDTEGEWYDDSPMSQADHDQEIMDEYNEMITEFNRVDEDDEDDIDDWDSHHAFDDYNDAINDIYGDNNY